MENMTPHIGAIGEIDRLGQAVLDAIYEEEALRRPDVEEFGSVSLPEYLIQTLKLSTARQQAVSTYLTARRMLAEVL